MLEVRTHHGAEPSPEATEIAHDPSPVAENGAPLNDPGGSGSLAMVSPRHIVDVIHAAESCPGECIFIEIDVPLGAVEIVADDDPDTEAA